MSTDSLPSLAVRPDQTARTVDESEVLAPSSARARLQREIFARRDRPQELNAYLDGLSTTERRWAVEILQNLRRPAPPFRRKAKPRPSATPIQSPATAQVCTQAPPIPVAQTSAPAPTATSTGWWANAKTWAREKAIGWAKSIIASWNIDPERFFALFAKVGDAVELVKKVVGAPVQFFQNLIRTLIGGAEGFWDKKWEHLRSGVIEWLTGRTGISITEFSASGMLHMLMQLIGLSAQTLETKARAQIQKRHAEDEKQAAIETHTTVAAQVDRTVEQEAKRSGIGNGRIGALKAKAQAHAQKQGIFSQVWSYVREKIRVLFQSGFRGLFESLAGDVRSLFSGLYDEILREVWQRALVEGARLALVLTVPFGPIVKVAQTVWRGIEWLIAQGGRLLGILETVADAMTEIVSGDTRPAATRITDVLKRLLAPLLDGLGRLVGIPNFSHKISEFCSRLATRVQNAFVGLVNRVYDKARGLFRRNAEPETETADKPATNFQPAVAQKQRWVPRVITFFMGHGEHRERHRLREVLGANPQLMMASEEKSMDERGTNARNGDSEERSLAAAVEQHNVAWKKQAQNGNAQAALKEVQATANVLATSAQTDFGDPKATKIPAEILRVARASSHGWFLNKFSEPAHKRYMNWHSDEASRYGKCEFVKIGLGRDLWYHLLSTDGRFTSVIATLRQSDVRMKLFTDALANNGHLFEAYLDSAHERELEAMVRAHIFQAEPSDNGRYWTLLVGRQQNPLPAPVKRPEDVNEKIPQIILTRAQEHPHGWFNASGFSDEERRFMNHHTEMPSNVKSSAAPHKRIPLFCRLAVRKNVKTSYYYHLLPNPLPTDVRYNSIFETLMIAALDRQLDEKMTFEFLEFADYERRGLFEKRGDLWILKPPPYAP